MRQVEIEPVPFARKDVLRSLLQLYIYDFTEFEQRPLGEDGRYAYPYFDEYWAPASGEQRFAYFVRVDGELAGMAMVRVVNGSNVMSEFFVMRPHRRGGTGMAAARAVFKAHPGNWIVHEHPANLPAQAFWRRAIGAVTNGDFAEVIEPDGAVTQRFTIPGA
jgi:predicted acetyltransferase